MVGSTVQCMYYYETQSGAQTQAILITSGMHTCKSFHHSYMYI